MPQILKIPHIHGLFQILVGIGITPQPAKHISLDIEARRMRFEAADKQCDFSLHRRTVLSLPPRPWARDSCVRCGQDSGGIEWEQRSSPCPTHQVQGLSVEGGPLSHLPKAPMAGGGPTLSKELPACNLWIGWPCSSRALKPRDPHGSYFSGL